MPIIYYQDSKFKKTVNPVERLLKSTPIQSETFTQDLTASGLNYVMWRTYSWELKEALFKFSGATGKDYSINKLVGRGIITNLNDSLWIGVTGSSTQRIILDQGFYTDVTLASQIKSKMDANQVFIDAGATPFTVGYASNKIKITAAGSAEISYLYENTTVGVNRHSTAGVVIGFMSDKALANSIESDTLVPMLGQKIVITSATGDTTTDMVVHELNPAWHFDIDQAFSFDVSTVALTVDGNVIFQESN